MLQNGQILYTRWEYVDRSQVHYHHLWTMNVDGTRQQVFFGNKEPNDVYIDAKAIPDSDDVVTIVSPGHGITDHRGRVAVLTPKLGPDDLSAFTFLTRANDYTDPWAFSENLFMASRYAALVLLNRDGFEQAVYTLPEEERAQEYRICEPRPIMARPKEKITAELPPTDETTGTLILSNIYHGRRMQDVPKGSIKELLVLETLPEPIHYSGGMDMISSGGTFTLERILGTVPVTPEGAAAIKLPANRSIFFIALDHEGRLVKRMHSFTSVMPGEKTPCIGCHENELTLPVPISINKSSISPVSRSSLFQLKACRKSTTSFGTPNRCLISTASSVTTLIAATQLSTYPHLDNSAAFVKLLGPVEKKYARR